MSSTFDRFQENLSSIKSPFEIISLLIKKIEENNSKCHIILNKSIKPLHFINNYIKVKEIDYDLILKEKKIWSEKYFSNKFNLEPSKTKYKYTIVNYISVGNKFKGLIYISYNKKYSYEILLNQLNFEISNLIEKENLRKKINAKNNLLKNKTLEIESLFDITEMLNSDENLKPLFDKILYFLISLFNASKGIIFLRDANSKNFNVQSSFNYDLNKINSRIIRDTRGVHKELKESFKSRIINNPKKYPLLEEGKLNCISGPIISNKKLDGSIFLFDKESRKGLTTFNNYDLKLFDSIIKKISLTYNNLFLVHSLKDSKKMIDSIMSSISTGIIKINMLGEIEYINESASSIFKVDSKSIINNHYAILFHNNQEILDILERAENSSHIFYEENLKINTNENNIGAVNLTISPVFDDGINSGMVVTLEDLSNINKVKSTFKKYVSESIVDELLLNEDSLELGGVQKDVCVLFADIRGFTSMSENLEPEKVVSLLNNYFQKMINVVFKNNGTLDKIIGDELMVLYGVPISYENDNQNAVNTAIEMFKELKVFNEKIKDEGLPEISIGIGINFGKVISGNIGSDQQMNYTVIGDNVNIAARLCSVAKPGEIIISDSVYNKLNTSSGFNLNKPLNLKGKSKPIKNWLMKVS